MQKTFFTPQKLARIGVLGALASALYLWPEIPVIPPIYKLDFSTVPILLAGFSMGPLGALFTLLIKDITGLFHSSSMGVGELADFFMTGSLTFIASAIYLKNRTFKGALIGMGAGIALMAVMGAIMNYFVLIPFYVAVMKLPLEKIIAMIQDTIPSVTNLFRLIVIAVVPFNLLKGVVVSLVTILLYKRVSPLLK